jgi:hypothetical protein
MQSQLLRKGRLRRLYFNAIPSKKSKRPISTTKKLGMVGHTAHPNYVEGIIRITGRLAWTET